jgi:hypothetical protein
MQGNYGSCVQHQDDVERHVQPVQLSRGQTYSYVQTIMQVCVKPMPSKSKVAPLLSEVYCLRVSKKC